MANTNRDYLAYVLASSEYSNEEVAHILTEALGSVKDIEGVEIALIFRDDIKYLKRWLGETVE